MPQLTELEVEEVSLVDRPATGRRFRIFKRASSARLLERLMGGGEGNICSKPTPGTEMEEPPGGLVSLEKRVGEALDAVLHSLEDLTGRVEAIQKRLDDAVSGSSRVDDRTSERQSMDPRPTGQTSLWKGVF